jgi:hypothetical protein
VRNLDSAADLPRAASFSRLLCVSSTLPDFWIAMTVNAGQHNDVLVGHNVEDAIGESTEQGSSYITVDDRIREWIALDRFKTLIECETELVTKFVTSVAVPRENTFDVRLRGGRKAESHFLRASESRTCDQGRAAWGSFKWSARRRSSSLR